MLPVSSALLVPEPDSVHELVDDDASVNAARAQGHLQQIHFNPQIQIRQLQPRFCQILSSSL